MGTKRLRRDQAWVMWMIAVVSSNHQGTSPLYAGQAVGSTPDL
jgi:hypothetical protein